MAGRFSLRRLSRTWAARAIAVYAALFAVSAAALLWFVYLTTTGFIERQINATVSAELNGLSERYREHGLSGLVEAISERLAADRSGDAVYFLADAAQQPVAGNLDAWPTTIQRQGRWATFDIAHTIEHSGQKGAGGRVRAITFTLPETYRLLVGRNLRELENFENLIVESLVYALIVAVLLAAVGGVIVSRDMRRRLDGINRTTDRIRGGALEERVPVSGAGDEFDHLSENLNAMLGQIAKLMAGMKEVTDNVAHDLRSPLTRLKTRLEITLLNEQPTDQYRRVLYQTVAEIDQVLSTFNALLSIAQAESGAQRNSMEAVDLTALCNDLAELYEPVADLAGIGFTATMADGVGIIGNRHLLFQAISNLVDNAIKYSHPGDHVALALTLDGQVARVCVADSGPGIPEADRNRVRQRFVRLDVSRSTPGNGLGLSLVEAVTHLHHGRLDLEDNQPGLKAVLTLPATEPVAAMLVQ